jgi:predicted metal-dependent HD superfamily phosphohydrolase
MGEGGGGGEREQLRERWDRACAGAGTSHARAECFDQLYAAYKGPDRFYHGIGHIRECLAELDSARELARDPRAIELAIWFHDVVYDGRRTDNEERSAEMARKCLGDLGVADGLREEVRQLILYTRHDREPPDLDGKIMVDIDLASLGRPAEVFDENTRLIRREYPHVADADFARGRRDMLGRFLARPRIYHTDFFRDRYEAKARENLSRALAKL